VPDAVEENGEHEKDGELVDGGEDECDLVVEGHDQHPEEEPDQHLEAVNEFELTNDNRTEYLVACNRHAVFRSVAGSPRFMQGH
jgi:hypothetical protein